MRAASMMLTLTVELDRGMFRAGGGTGVGSDAIVNSCGEENTRA